MEPITRGHVRTDLDTEPIAVGRWEGFPLAELPVHVLAIVLSKTTPRDACRLAAVSKSFAEAAESDLLWREFLPPGIQEILVTVEGGNPHFERVKDLYKHFTNHVLLGDGSTGYFIDRGTGGVSRTFSAKTLSIVWSDTPSYWEWLPSEGSRFQEVAFLRLVWWMELSGTISCRLPPGIYTLSWVLKFGVDSYGWNFPVKFSSTDGTQVHENAIPTPSERQGHRTILDQYLQGQGRNRDEWWECNAGNFAVTKIDDAENLGEMNLNFSMIEIEAGRSKRGLYVDGVIISRNLELEGTS